MENLKLTTLRTNELNILKTYVEKGIPACLIGISGLGKTQLLKDLIRVYSDKYPLNTILNINISDENISSTGGVFKALLNKLGKYEKEPVFSDGFSDIDRDYGNLKLCLTEEFRINKHKKILFVIDNLDCLIETNCGRLPELIGSLKKEFNGRLSIVASCQKQIPIFNLLFLANIVTLKPLSLDDYREFTGFLLNQSPFALTQTQLDDLYRISGGHPRYTYAIISAATSSINGLNWSKFVDTAFLRPEIRIISENIWNSLTTSEKNVLKYWPKYDYNDKNQYASILALEKMGFFKRVGGEYKIFSLAFESFLKMGCLREIKKQGIDINPNTERVSRDGETLSVKLSPTESVLLKYLVKRKNQLVLRKDIINEISSISPNEISDTALDQTVSRLRAKIEIERNNPKYFHTIRGKGFQLVDN